MKNIQEIIGDKAVCAEFVGAAVDDDFIESLHRDFVAKVGDVDFELFVIPGGDISANGKPGYVIISGCHEDKLDEVIRSSVVSLVSDPGKIIYRGHGAHRRDPLTRYHIYQLMISRITA